MQCKGKRDDRGRYLVNVGEKCILIIPWTKVQKYSLLILASQLISSRKHFVLWTNQMPVAFKMSIEMSSEQAKWFLTFQFGTNFIFLKFILLALVVLSSITKKGEIVAKMASHATFQYNVLAIDDTRNT